MEKRITIPTDLLAQFKELPCTAEKEKNTAARSILVKILSALSDEALDYVWRPIMYAYLWTDCHGHDRLTDDDMHRIHISCLTTNGSPAVVERLDSLCLAVEKNMR